MFSLTRMELTPGMILKNRYDIEGDCHFGPHSPYGSIYLHILSYTLFNPRGESHMGIPVYQVLKDKIKNLNLDSLLVKRQIDNPSPGAVTGGN